MEVQNTARPPIVQRRLVINISRTGLRHNHRSTTKQENHWLFAQLLPKRHPKRQKYFYFMFVWKRLYYFYHPQTKLQEGNVFTSICLFRSSGVGMSHASCDRSHGRVPMDIRPGDLPPTLVLTSGGYDWKHVQTCSLQTPASTDI